MIPGLGYILVGAVASMAIVIGTEIRCWNMSRQAARKRAELCHGYAEWVRISGEAWEREMEIIRMTEEAWGKKTEDNTQEVKE
jgi:hypothetical protein